MEKIFSASDEGTGKEKTVSSESKPIFASDNLKQDDSRSADSSDGAKSNDSILRELIRENLKGAGRFTDEEATEYGAQIYEKLVKAFVVETEAHSSQDTSLKIKRMLLQIRTMIPTLTLPIYPLYR